MIEKPFGRDYGSAQALNQVVQSCGQENQIFRIDHYLGKETVQNILVLRFANTIFEPIWNRNYISSVQITAAETVGVEERAGYYESSGALRDMVQNHLTQMLAITAMEARDGSIRRRSATKKPRFCRRLAWPMSWSPGIAASVVSTAPVAPGIPSGWLSPGTGCRSQQHNGDLRRPETVHRQLALAGCSLLCPNRQTPGQASQRSHAHLP